MAPIVTEIAAVLGIARDTVEGRPSRARSCYARGAQQYVRGPSATSVSFGGVETAPHVDINPR